MTNVYVIYGENQFKIDNQINDIITTNKVEDIIKYDMTISPLISAIIDAQTMSLFNDKKAIICENAYFLNASKSEEPASSLVDFDELTKYIANPNPNSFLFFTTNRELDSKKEIVKVLTTKAKLIACSKATHYDFVAFAKNKFKENNFQINNNVIEELVSRTGSDYKILSNEIDKLMLYKLTEKEIIHEDVEELVYKNIEDNIYILIDNLIKNDKAKAFEIYDELTLRGVEPMQIIVLLGNQYRLIYQVKELTARGLKESEICSKLDVKPYPVKLAKQKAHYFTKKQLKEYLNQLADLDYKIKTGQIDENLGLELFCLQI